MDGLNEAVVYSLVINGSHSNHQNYKQIKHSISSIRSFSNIDIYLYFSSPFEIDDLFFKNNNVNIIKFKNDFKRWTSKIPVYPWNEHLHHRWINIFNFFKDYAYDRIIYLDTDTIFYKSPEDFLSKYDKNVFYVKQEFKDNVTQNFVKHLNINPGINDGQIIIARKEIDKIKDNFESKWVDTINYMTDLVYNELNSDTDHVFFWNVSQYAIFKIILEEASFDYFEEEDVSLGISFEHMNKDDIFIHHYFSGNMIKYYKETYDN